MTSVGVAPGLVSSSAAGRLPHFALLAEIGPADGDLSYALDCVREAARAKVWGVKAQFYEADSLASPDAEPYWQGGTGRQRDYYQRQLSGGEWAVVADACHEHGLQFLASVFDLRALALSESLGCQFVKVASGDITNRPLLDAVSRTGRTVLLSCGASYEHEIRRALFWLEPCPVLPLACSLEYPTPPSRANLQRIPVMRDLFGPVGYSNHVPGMGAVVGARRLGAVLVETHFTAKPGCGGDHDFAVTAQQILDADWGAEPFGFRQMIGWPTDLAPHVGERAARLGARRSLHAAMPIRRGEVFTPDNLTALRPMPGWEPWQIDFLLGSRASRDYAAGERVE